MPFLCDVTVPETGVVVGYWHESELVYNMKVGKVSFTISGYVNEAAYVAGKFPVVSKSFEISEGSQPQLATTGKAFLLGYVRALPEFEGSEDVT
ncbi:MAG: hypothetical protein IPJ03_16505 [Ignavibacteriales bacterium]|nr:hypothetical protein [Ignavibacteriales bacterium]